MPAFTQVAHRHQLDLDEPPFIGGENPCEADMIGDGDEYQQFRTRLDSAGHQLRLRTCAAFELGHATGAVAFNILITNGLLGDLDEFMAVYCAGIWKLHHEDHSAGVRSLAEGAR